MKALFLPLKTEFYNGFEAGSKTTEFRPYGPRWNEKTCVIGRSVTLSHGYGKNKRLQGVIVGFEKSCDPTSTPAWQACYGDKHLGMAACIHIKVQR